MNKKLKVLIIEDDPIYVKLMINLLRNYNIEDINVADNYSDGKKCLLCNKYDIALIDIFIAGEKTGLSLGNYIKENYRIPFIYVTSSLNDTVLDMLKDSHPAAVIGKPIDKNTFISNIKLAVHNYHAKEDNLKTLDDRIFIKKDGIFEKVYLNDIVYVKSDHIYNNIYTKDGKRLLIRGRLRDFYERFPNCFMQINRGCAINVNYIDHYDKQMITVNNIILEIGRKYKNQVYSRLVSF
jgi:DNA-binding LytR/AlgR family response regulator